MSDNPKRCRHRTKMQSCGIKVCFDCGAPLNDLARRLASQMQPRKDRHDGPR